VNHISPETLTEESELEARERQVRTGVLGAGTNVVCRPDPTDPSIMQTQHRAACLHHPFAGCAYCPHQTFTLIFKSVPADPYEILSCPRWGSEADRMNGSPPVSYVPVERALCSQRPFPFCSSCPTKEELDDLGADKGRSGWYGRWHRIMKSLLEEDESE
jgi:hypothetical protein